MPAPAADDEADGRLGGGAAGKARKRKGKDPRAELEECCVRLLQNSSRDGHMTVETLGQAVADAMGGTPSWNKKWRQPLVGSLKEFAGSSRALGVAHVNGECRALRAPSTLSSRARRSPSSTLPANGAKAAGGGGGAAGAGKRVLRFIGTRALAAGLALLAASLRGGACRARPAAVLDCARPCAGTAAGVGGGECVPHRSARPSSHRWCARRWAPALREGAMTLAPVGARPDIVGASSSSADAARRGAARAAAADGHACEPPKPRCSGCRGRTESCSPSGCSCARRGRRTRPTRPPPRHRSRAPPPPPSQLAGARRGAPAAFIALAHGACAAFQRARQRGRRARRRASRASRSPEGIRRGLKTQGRGRV